MATALHELRWSRTSLSREFGETTEVATENCLSRSQTSVSMEVCFELPMRRCSSIHDQLFRSLRDLGADYIRLTPWRPYPRLAVAELEPAFGGRHPGSLSLPDPVLVDFMQGTAGHSVDMDISTIPQRMFKVEREMDHESYDHNENAGRVARLESGQISPSSKSPSPTQPPGCSSPKTFWCLA
jgi:hypothetical protein